MNLITDRTQSDVTYALALATKIQSGTATEDELAEWNGAALRGSYNASDLNRVGGALLYVAGRLNGFGYAVSVTPKTDWTETDIPTFSDVMHYLSDLSTLREALAVMQSTPEVPSDMDRMTYTEANDIEKILEDIDALLTKAAQAWFYSDDVFSGEV